MKDRKGTVTSVRTIVNVQVITDRDEGEYRSMGERRTAPSVRGKGVHHDLRCNNL